MGRSKLIVFVVVAFAVKGLNVHIALVFNARNIRSYDLLRSYVKFTLVWFL